MPGGQWHLADYNDRPRQLFRQVSDELNLDDAMIRSKFKDMSKQHRQHGDQRGRLMDQQVAKAVWWQTQQLFSV